MAKNNGATTAIEAGRNTALKEQYSGVINPFALAEYLAARLFPGSSWRIRRASWSRFCKHHTKSCLTPSTIPHFIWDWA